MQNHLFRPLIGCISFVLCLVILTPGAAAQDAQAQCNTVLQQTETLHVVATYSVTNMDRDGWRVGPDPSSQFGETHVYTERSDWLSEGDLIAFEIATIQCVDGALAVDGSADTNLRTIEQAKHGFEPPLTWLPFPVEPGHTWLWNGVYSHFDGQLNRQYQVTFYGFVGEPKTVATPAGSFRCHPVTTEMTFFADTAQSTTRTESCISTDPYYLVVERTRQLVGLESGPVQEFRLLSVETGFEDSP